MGKGQVDDTGARYDRYAGIPCAFHAIVCSVYGGRISILAVQQEKAAVWKEVLEWLQGSVGDSAVKCFFSASVSLFLRRRFPMFSYAAGDF